jgi:hypothetical protein
VLPADHLYEVKCKKVRQDEQQPPKPKSWDDAIAELHKTMIQPISTRTKIPSDLTPVQTYICFSSRLAEPQEATRERSDADSAERATKYQWCLLGFCAPKRGGTWQGIISDREDLKAVSKHFVSKL